MKYGKILTYENRNEAEIGKRYVFSNNWMFIYKIVNCQLSPKSKLIEVKDSKLLEIKDDCRPFRDEDGVNFQFIREVIEETEK